MSAMMSTGIVRNVLTLFLLPAALAAMAVVAFLLTPATPVPLVASQGGGGVEIGFADSAITAAEGDDIDLRVELTGGGTADGNITLNVDYSGGGGYTASPTVTIASGASSATLQLNVPRDRVARSVPETLTVTLRLSGNDDDGVELSPTGAAAKITILNRDLALDGSEFDFTGVLPGFGEHRWYLNDVPKDTLFVAWTLALDIRQALHIQLLAADGTPLKPQSVSAFGGIVTNNLTHRVTDGDTDFILLVGEFRFPGLRRHYGLFVEEANMVGTLEYNAPEGLPVTIPASRLPSPHYYRVVVPPEAAGHEVTLSARSATNERFAVRLLSANGNEPHRNEIAATFSMMPEIKQTLAAGEYLLVVNGEIPGPNLNDPGVRDYVVTLRGPEFVGFAADDLSRTVPVNETFTLTVAVAPGLGVATQDVTLDVGYSGGGGVTGPATVTIPKGARSVELPLQAPCSAPCSTPPDLTVTLSNPPSGSLLLQNSEEATIMFTTATVVGFTESAATVNEGEDLTLTVQLAGGRTADGDLTLDVGYSGGGGGYTGPPTVTIDAGAGSATLQLNDLPRDRMAGSVPDPLIVTLSLSPGGGNDIELLPIGASAEITFLNRDLELDGSEVTDELTEAGQVHRWYLTAVPDDVLLVVQSLNNVDVEGRLLTRDGDDVTELRKVNNFLNQVAFRITYPVTSDASDFIIEVFGRGSATGTYGLFAETGNVVGTLEYNAPEGPSMTIETSTLPTTHYYRVAVPADADEHDVMLSATSAHGDQMRVELLNADGSFVANEFEFLTSQEIEQTLEPGGYLFVVNGWVGQNHGNMNQRALRDYTVTLRGPEFVGFAADDLTRSVPEGETFTLTVGVAPGMVAADQDVTLDVGYSGGNNYLGPGTVTIPSGTSSVELLLRVPGDGIAGTMAPPLTVTLSNPSSGALPLQGFAEATITFTDDTVALVGFADSAVIAGEGEELTLTVGLSSGVADGDLTLNVDYMGGGGYTGPSTVTIDAGAGSGMLQLKLPRDGVVGTAPETLTVTLSLSPGGGDSTMLSPTGAAAEITILNRDLATDRIEVTGELTEAGQTHRWHLTAAPEDELLVVQSLNQINVQGRLLNADGAQLRDVDDFLDQVAFRIAHRVTGTADFIIEVRGRDNNTRGEYGLIAELATVVGTAEYNAPEGSPRTIDGSDLPQTHYYRVVVPEGAAGQEVRVIAASNNDGMRVELLNADGALIEQISDFNGTPRAGGFFKQFTMTLDPGDYYLAVNGWGGSSEGNRNQRTLHGVVVTLRGPEFVGFAMEDVARTVPEGETFTLTVAVAPGMVAADQDVTLDVDYSGGGGYTGPATVTIPSGGTSTELSLRVPGDGVANTAPAPLTVTLSNPSSGSLLSQGSSVATVTFTDDAVPLVGFGAASYVFTEGERVTLPVELKPGKDLTGPLTVMVDITFPDRPQERRTVTLSASNRTANVMFDAPDDDRHAPPGEVTLEIVDNLPADQARLAPGFGMATVRFRDDGDPVARVGFGAAPATLDEGETTMLSVELAGTRPATRTVMVTVSDGMGFTRVVEIATGTSSTTFDYTAPDDQSAAPEEVSVTLMLSDPVDGGVNGAAATVEITVQNDDVVVAGFGAASYVFREGAEVTVPVELKTAVDPAGPVTVMVTGIPDPTMPGVTTSQEVTLTNTDRTRAITFTAPDDERHAPPPPVTLMLSVPQGVEAAAGLSMATVRFTDDNDPIAVVRFVGEASQSRSEGEMATLRVELTGSKPATRAIEVRARLSGGLDAVRTLTIETGANFGLLPITLPGDDVDFAAPDPVVATLIGPQVSGLYRVAAAPTERVADIRIRDDDGEASVGFKFTEYAFREGALATVTVELKSRPPASPVTVRVAGFPDGQTRTVALSAAVGFGDFTFTAPENDYSNIAPPAIELTLSVAQDAAERFEGFATATVRFRDDDPVPETRFVGELPRLGAEGESVTLQVKLQEGVTATRAIAVRVALSGGTETSLTITIPRNADFGEVTFLLPDDNTRNTAPAAVVAKLVPGDDSYAVVAGAGEVAITVADYDALALVGFAETTLTVSAGETATLQVELANGVIATRAVSVAVNFNDGRAVERVEIETGSRYTQLQVPVSGALVLTLSSPTNAVLVSDSEEASISIGSTSSPPPSSPPPSSPPPSPPPPSSPPPDPVNGGGGGTLMLTVVPAGPSEVSEGDEITYTITRTDAAAAISVRVGVSPRSSGANANDLETVETVELAAGATSIEHVVTALLDANDESDERFAVTFTPVDDRGTTLGPRQSSDLTVTNLAPFVLTTAAAELSEGAIALVRVTRPEGVAMDRQFTLSIEALRVSPRGAATEDLQVPATVTLRSGAQFADFRVLALSDMLEEPDERFSVSVAGGGTLTFTVTDTGLLPGAGGVELAWWQLAALAFAGVLALLAAAVLPRAWRRSR